MYSFGKRRVLLDRIWHCRSVKKSCDIVWNGSLCAVLYIEIDELGKSRIFSQKTWKWFAIICQIIGFRLFGFGFPERFKSFDTQKTFSSVAVGSLLRLYVVSQGHNIIPYIFNAFGIFFLFLVTRPKNNHNTKIVSWIIYFEIIFACFWNLGDTDRWASPHLL